MIFKDYMWALLTRPFKSESSVEVKAYTGTVGELLDEVKLVIFKLRRQWIILTADESALKLLGEERGIYRYDEESLSSYRSRVLLAYKFYADGGTVPGIIRAVQSLGYDEVSIIERSYTWANFTVCLHLELGGVFLKENFRRLDQMVFKTKPAHTLPLYVIEYAPAKEELPLEMDFTITAEYYGRWHAWWWQRDVFRLDGTIPLNGCITLGEGWADVVDLDGSTLLNGSSKLDGCSKIQEDGWSYIDNFLNLPYIDIEIMAIMPMPSDLARLDGTSVLDGSLPLDGLRHSLTSGIELKTFAESIAADGTISRLELVT